MKTIIFGGFFDPIHNGHISIAKKALSVINADRVIFVPCANSPSTKQFSCKYEDRLKMCKLAVSTYESFFVSNIEEKIEGPSYSFKTLELLIKKYPEDDFYILMGSDEYNELDNWRNHDFIQANAVIVVYPRNSKNINKKNDKDIIIEGKTYDISSSKLILKMEEGKINSDVLDYINKNAIYAIRRMHLYGISEYRINHSIQVANLAVEFSRKYGLETAQKAFVAGIYHDFFKESSSFFLEEIAKKKLGIYEYINWKILHGPVAGYMMQKLFCIKDIDITEAISNHVILNKPDSTLNKIIFCADKLALRNNNFKDRELMIDIAKENINAAYKMIQQNLDIIYKNN
ncbi:MAG: nicotinate (nicotinamide) nucleotide adenylyltransferase [Mycoplasmoidaceae bacterium]